MQSQHDKDTCGPSDSTGLPSNRLAVDDRSQGKERLGSSKQDQLLPGMTADAISSVRAAADGKQAPVAKADAVHSRDHHQPRDVAAAGRSAFAALATSIPEFGTSAGSDAGSFMRQPRGVEAMMGGQRRTHSGALTSPSGLSDHGSLLVERALSSSSAHRALLGGGVSPDSAAAAAAATTAALLELPEDDHPVAASRECPQNSTPAAELAPTGDAVQQQHQQQPSSDGAAAAAAGLARRSAGITRPTVLIPSPETSMFGAQVMASPASQLVHPYSGGTIPVDELDLDVIDDIPSVDALGLSASSSPTISGAAAAGRSTPGHLRGSRDFDLRRVAVVNSMLSPSMQHAAHISAHSTAGGDMLSISAEGGPMVPQLPAPAMFTGATRGRALPGSNNSLQSVASGAEQYTSTESSDTMQQLLSLRMSRGSTPSPAPNGSPARPRSATAAATPRVFTAGSSRASSAMGSPVPPPSQGPAAALLAGSVVASPRTPHSPLSVILSPRPQSARVLSTQQTPLPGPLFGSGFGALPAAAGASPGTSPGTSSVAAPSSTASSCCTGSGAGIAVQPPAGAGGRSSLLSSGGNTLGARRFASPSPTPAAASEAQQQGEGAQPQQQPTQMQQHLRQQLMQSDTRLGPHGGSPLSPSHHQLPPRGDALLSPSCPTPLVPPALMSAGSHNRQPVDGVPAGAAPDPGAASAGRTAGGVGHLSIHEWLDHQSWRLPYEVPQGLRDAADVREAAAQEQQHTQSRMAPGRGPNSRSTSQRNSLSNLDSPGALHQSPGSGLGRFPAGTHLLVPPPALQLHQHGLVQAQHNHHQQQGIQRQPAEVLLHRRLAAIHAAQAAGHEHSSSWPQATVQQRQEDTVYQDGSLVWDAQAGEAGPGRCFAGLSVGTSGPLQDVRHPVPPARTGNFGVAEQDVRHSVPPARTGNLGVAEDGCTEAGLSWQQQRSQQQQLTQAGAAETSSSGGDRVGLSLLGQSPWPLPMQRQHLGSAAVQQQGGTVGAPPLCTSDQAWHGHVEHGGDMPGTVAGACPMQVQQQGDAHAGREGGASSGAHVVQLGAGSHLYPAGSPVRHGSCCYSCQHSACPAGQPGAHSCPRAAAGVPGVQAGRGNSSSSTSSSVDRPQGTRPAGRALCAPLDVLQYQQSAAPATWRQLQSPLMSPNGQFAFASAGHGSQHAQYDQHVLPGVAELLQRRHEQQQRRQLVGVSRAATVAASSAGATAPEHAGVHVNAGTIAIQSDGVGSSRGSCGMGLATTDGVGSSGGGCGMGLAPADMAVLASSSSDVAAPPQKTSVTPDCGSCGSNGGTHADIAMLLADRGFMESLLSKLPGVDQQSGTVWAAVAELQEVLSTQSRTAT